MTNTDMNIMAHKIPVSKINTLSYGIPSSAGGNEFEFIDGEDGNKRYFCANMWAEDYQNSVAKFKNKVHIIFWEIDEINNICLINDDRVSHQDLTKMPKFTNFNGPIPNSIKNSVRKWAKTIYNEALNAL